MTSSRSRFLAALAIGWAMMGVAGVLFARFKGIPTWAAGPALAAFLIAYPFYLLPAFPDIRERVAGWRLPVALAAATAMPYLACCMGALSFRWLAFAQLAALALTQGLWFYALPKHPLTDVAFLALVAWVMLGKYFRGVYSEPFPGLELSILGSVAVYLNAILALLVARRTPDMRYGFIPNLREWRIGGLYFLCFLPFGAALLLGLKAGQLGPPRPWWVIAGTFLGFLWVIGLAEEFLFRGVIQGWFEQWTSSRVAGLLIASLIFGLVHIPFRGWKWAPIAGVLGLFCGLARNSTGGIRAAVVTHALVVTAWRAFFR